MFSRRRNSCGGNPKFFRLTFRHDTLKNYYETNFALMQHHKYSLTELDNLIPWEKTIYISLLSKHIEEEVEKMKQQKNNRKRT
jgi:hypothetical protein